MKFKLKQYNYTKKIVIYSNEFSFYTLSGPLFSILCV